MGRDAHPKKSLGSSLHSRIKESRVLMVGAGGIGCELLKNLVMTGFGEIHLVDLDTIDLSNLNRQFLFGMQHIKKSKAIVAKETAGKFNPNVKLKAYHANIKDSAFNVKWFKSFDIVFNALDNLEARKHVNKMCLAADVPLIESGTTGYNGQVQTIKRGATECYDCNPKPVPKSFPVCTIRSTPSQPIHCIVWAKGYLLAEVFGMSEESSPELDPTETSENAQEIANLKREAEELKSIREKMDSSDFAESIFQKVFKRDIERLLLMEDMWKSRAKPKPLDFAATAEAAKDINGKVAREDQRKWTLGENYAVFADSIRRLAQRMRSLKAEAKEGDAPPVISFDKDDEDTLDFVSAGANLRSLIFGIDARSKFDVKQMAGNIIPAIATTNAITAGLCVLQALQVLRNNLPAGRMVFLAKNVDRAFSVEKLAPPQPSCQTCSVARVTVEALVLKATLGDLYEKVLQPLGYNKEISIITSSLLYDIDYDDNWDTPLKELGFDEETFVTVVDEDEEQEKPQRVNLVVVVSNNNSLEEELVTSPVKIDIPRRSKQPKEAEDELEIDGVTQTNGVTNGISNEASGTKRAVDHVADVEANGVDHKRRKIEEDLTVLESRAPKKARTDIGNLPSENDLIVLDDNGIITID